MKNDMTGAGEILAAMSALAELGRPNKILSGSAIQLGDVLTMYGG